MKYFPIIKVCGLTRFKDIRILKKYGVKFLGFIFAESPRKIDIKKAEEILPAIKNAYKTGVFVNENINKINYLIKKFKLNYVQMCGDEGIKDIKLIKGAKVIKVLRPVNVKKLKSEIKKYKKYVHCFLLDTYKKGKYGGTGEKFDWNFIDVIKKSGKPYFIAGGINPQNIKELIVKYKPYGIDVNSGIEESYGKKSAKKIKMLFNSIAEAIKLLETGEKNKNVTR